MRYLLLVALNLPVIFLALLEMITRYKLLKMSARRFRVQLIFWLTILAVLVASYPAYNYLSGRPPLDSHELSLFDIAQTTAIIALVYVLNNIRQRAQSTEHTLRDLHQQLSLTLSDYKKNTREDS